MDQPSPPRPALFLRFMLILQPSRLCQLLSNLWVTQPIPPRETAAMAGRATSPEQFIIRAAARTARARTAKRHHKDDAAGAADRRNADAEGLIICSVG